MYIITTGPNAAGGHSLMCSGFEIFGQIGRALPPPPKPLPPKNLAYAFPFELYVPNGEAVTPNRCTLESGTNCEGCRISFGAFPALPPGLTVDPDTGTISGALDWEALAPATQRNALKAIQLDFTITAKNVAGRARCKVRILLLRVAITYIHTYIHTYT